MFDIVLHCLLIVFQQIYTKNCGFQLIKILKSSMNIIGNPKFGIYPVRKCKQIEQKVIKDKLQKLRHIFDLNKNQTLNWVHVYLNEKFCWGTQQQEKDMKKVIDDLILQVQDGVPHYITSYGYIKSPVNATKDQLFHFDYNETYKAIFIPMTSLVTQNSPRFLAFQTQKKNYETYIDYGVSEKRILEVEGVDFLTVHQVISKPFVVLKMQSGTIHRGVMNRTNQDRYMFFIGYNKQKMILDYEETYKQVTPNKD